MSVFKKLLHGSRTASLNHMQSLTVTNCHKEQWRNPTQGGGGDAQIERK